ncbi:TELO2-interacting protein 2 [Falco cherrug]|uniref:TELO2-interacting protein 2 n=1 Tax=Falco cherrug TaxID=345164 RepID=UPI00247A831A|nr:TELO2-interacting protein 2 [Falco cherrug]
MELSGLLRALRLEGPRDGAQPPPAVPPAEQVLLQIGLLCSEGPGGAHRASVVRDLGALVEAADCQWLLAGVSPATLGELVAALSGYAAPPKQEQEAADLPSKDSAYTAAAERAADVGAVFVHLLVKLEAAKTQEALGVPMVGPILRRVVGPIYIFAATHVVERPWTNVRSRSAAQKLLVLLVQAAGCESVAEFLQGKNEDEEGRFAAVMGLLKQELTKDTWKCNPATKFVFSWTLPHVTRPWLSRYLECVLPPSLLISDDYREENKILGVRCLHHIILNVPGADLCQFNRAQVVYHALYNHLYSREAPLIQAVLLCLLDLLPILERAQRQQKQARPTALYDEVLQLVLTHMEAEHRLALRRVYARALPAFVRRLGILIARHLKRLERVILGYLEVCDGPEEEARLGILETLQCTIEHAWPRMPCRLPVLLKALLKMIWDVHTDQSSTPEPVKAALLQGATECLILLDRCSEGQVKVLLAGVYSSCEENRVRECIRKVQENT